MAALMQNEAFQVALWAMVKVGIILGVMLGVVSYLIYAERKICGHIQALSNWERDVNEPDLNTLKKICFLFGVHMDDFAKEVITKMETCEKKRNDNLISMIWQLDFFMVSGYFLALVFSLLAVL